MQPITLDLAQRLAEHARVRGAVLPTDKLLRYRDGRPLTSRRYDQLWKRIGAQLAWVAMHRSPSPVDDDQRPSLD